MKRIIIIAALLIAAATVAMAQNSSVPESMKFNYKRYFDLNYVLYDINQNGQADKDEIFEAPAMGKATAQLYHRYYGESYNKTRLDVSLESSEGDMNFSGIIDGGQLLTYDTDAGTYYHCVDGLGDVAFVIVKGDAIGKENMLIIFNIGAFSLVK